ncbi:MAG: hypothetical protein A3H70_00595 [Candidatus Komeilibacteria bacterium RIFCSPLOWO2_02_FULL_48_11]|uniref:Uncharacterized protein n=1 Tax=Candidatus Komeilibacteria bacterium RIFCSPLOWO2_02_FULL_48_11 TaxID=1798553 RepID=A0A1G2BTS4_9BACT|nr:MAG: hypothetical protein A3H70_00595 [Candidatus Komeilibacteria bacterium RIFCSPLOWO2_02_FULL_48_11]
MPISVEERVKQWNMQYRQAGQPDEPIMVQGIRFWRVGHNATCNFYAGVGADGALYYLGHDVPFEKLSEARLERVGNWRARKEHYWGHF